MISPDLRGLRWEARHRRNCARSSWLCKSAVLHLNLPQLKVIFTARQCNAQQCHEKTVGNCRSTALDGPVATYTKCSHQLIAHNSCRNRPRSDKAPNQSDRPLLKSSDISPVAPRRATIQSSRVGDLSLRRLLVVTRPSALNLRHRGCNPQPHRPKTARAFLRVRLVAAAAQAEQQSQTKDGAVIDRRPVWCLTDRQEPCPSCELAPLSR